MRRVLFAVVLVSGCREKLYDRTEKTVQTYKIPEPPPAAPPAAADPALPIPARSQGPGAPREGWCGETAIQEALLHVGVWAPQKLVNAAGHPTHPDLYSPDLPVALNELGVRFTMYMPKKPGFEPYAEFLRAAIDEGDPVIAGVKILPTEHPEWGLDHFVLVVGHGEKGFLVNTTWGRRAWIARDAKEGLAFGRANYAIRILGTKLPPGTTPARLAIVDEGETTITLHITCVSGEPERDVTIDASKIARFRCTPK